MKKVRDLILKKDGSSAVSNADVVVSLADSGEDREMNAIGNQIVVYQRVIGLPRPLSDSRRQGALSVGASLKDLGKKCFGFTKMDASEIAGIKARVK